MHGYRGKKYAGGIKRKRRWKSTEYKHINQPFIVLTETKFKTQNTEA
jgi:hypothetical protein